MRAFITLPGHQVPDSCGSQRGLEGGAWPGLDSQWWVSVLVSTRKAVLGGLGQQRPHKTFLAAKASPALISASLSDQVCFATGSPRSPGFPTPGSGASILRPHQGLLWFVFYWPPIILALAPRAISSFLGGGRRRLQNPRAFMSCPCASHSLFSGKESRKLNYVANAYSSRMSGFL